MDQPEPQSRPDAAEYPHAQHADEEHGVGVVAEGQKPLRLLPGQVPGGVQLRRRAGADGIASHQPQQQRGPGAAGQAEQGRHQASHIGRQPGLFAVSNHNLVKNGIPAITLSADTFFNVFSIPSCK